MANTHKDKCTYCRGHGRYLPADSASKADMKECHICEGTGVKPKWYTPNPLGKGGRPKHLKRTDGMEALREVEAV